MVSGLRLPATSSVAAHRSATTDVSGAEEQSDNGISQTVHTLTIQSTLFSGPVYSCTLNQASYSTNFVPAIRRAMLCHLSRISYELFTQCVTPTVTHVHFTNITSSDTFFEHFRIFTATWRALLHLTRIATHPYAH